jgi:hypothetical protein
MSSRHRQPTVLKIPTIYCGKQILLTKDEYKAALKIERAFKSFLFRKRRRELMQLSICTERSAIISKIE